VAARVYVCLFDLPAYDQHVAPALRLYRAKFDPSGVVGLLQNISRILPALRRDPDRHVPESDDCKHWIDAIEPDAGHKPSDATLAELAGMLIQNLSVPHGLGFNPMRDVEAFVPYLSDRSEWFADLMDGGEELAGGRLEFTFGDGSLIATRQQIQQFLEEVTRVEPPPGDAAAAYLDFRKLLQAAAASTNYTLLKTGVRN
jgi:hypothetical protein